MVYTSGKYVCLGGKSTVDMVTIARKVARKIQRIGSQPGGEAYQTIGFHNFSLNNISASAALGYRLNLRALSEDPAFVDYTEYEPEQWKGLHYRLPVDPTKTLADLLPSYAILLAQRQRAEQFSDDQFLGTGDHAATKGALSYYSTTSTTGSRSTPATAAAAGGVKVPFKVPPSLNGQILTATIYSNGRMTLTGVRREKDIFDAYLRFWRILQPFAQSMPPTSPPQQPPYPRIFMPGQRRRIKLEQLVGGVAPTRTEAEQAFPVRDIKPNVQLAPPAGLTSALFSLPAPSVGVKHQPVSGTFAVKSEFPAGVGSSSSRSGGFRTSGRDAAEAIVLEGLPDGGDAEQESKAEAQQATKEEEEVEWE
jgi:TATA-box binding protein (TBP) (component of TFIID and TFIIIB)